MLSKSPRVAAGKDAQCRLKASHQVYTDVKMWIVNTGSNDSLWRDTKETEPLRVLVPPSPESLSLEKVVPCIEISYTRVALQEDTYWAT